MIDSILAVIDGIENAAARPRLRRCLPSLSKVLAHFDRRSVSAGLLIAAATPDGATVLHADGWPQLDRSPLKQGEVVAALSAAIEAGDMVDGDIILASLTILLGQRGIEAQELDAAQIVEDSGQPIVVALLEHASDYHIADHHGRARCHDCSLTRYRLRLFGLNTSGRICSGVSSMISATVSTCCGGTRFH